MENLTAKETKALDILINGTQSNLNDDCAGVWAQPIDLIKQGYSKHEAAGLWSALLEKNVVELYEPRSKAEGGDLFLIETERLPQWKQDYIKENEY